MNYYPKSEGDYGNTKTRFFQLHVLGPLGCVNVAQNVRFSGRHGDLPLRKPVGATLCGRPYL
jgi:hypothetical protein